MAAQLEQEELELLTVLPEVSLKVKPKMDRRFLTLRLLQAGQLSSERSSECPTSSSNAFPHFRQSNSNIGIGSPHSDVLLA